MSRPDPDDPSPGLGVPGGLVGMVHLLPLPGVPACPGMDAVVKRARTDARALAGAGFDALLVENYGDAPFRRTVGPVTVAAMTAAVLAVMQEVDAPVGVNVLRNDARAALSVAAAAGARFIRVNVHTGGMYTDQGWIEGRAADTVRLRDRVAPWAAILADVMVKHAWPPPGLTLEAAARDAAERGRADGLVVSGAGTGEATSLDDVRAVKEAVPGTPVLIGSGVTADTVAAALGAAAGVIVGSALRVGGRAGAPVDPVRARRFVEAARG